MDTVLNAAASASTDVSPTIIMSEFDSFLYRHTPQGPFNWSFLLGALFAFLSQLSSIGKGLQKVGVQNLPELSFSPAILVQYLSSTPWRTGMILDIAGALCGLVSLTIMPISVAQPIFCNGLVLLACYSHFYLKEQLARREWRAIGLCFCGTVLLAVTLVPRDWSQTHVGWLQVKLLVVLLLVLPLICFAEMGIRSAKRNRGVPNRGPNRQAIELLVGLQAGLCIGVGNASLASGLQSTSRSWIDHVARELNGSISLVVVTDASAPQTEPWPADEPWPPGVWLHLVCAGAFAVVGSAHATRSRTKEPHPVAPCVFGAALDTPPTRVRPNSHHRLAPCPCPCVNVCVCAVAMNAMHPVFANRGYQHGRVVLISTHTALTSMATGVFVGIGVLDEAWPARPLMGAARVLAFVLMLTGACTMNRANIKAMMPGNRDKLEEPEVEVVCGAHSVAGCRVQPAHVPTAADAKLDSPGVHPSARRV